MDNGWTVFPTQGRWWFSLHCLFWGKHFWKLMSPRRASSGCYFRNPILNIQIFLLRLWITICYRNLIHKNAISTRVSCSLFTRSFFFEKLIWLSLVYDSKYVMSHTFSSHNLNLYWLFVRVNSLYIRVFHAVTLW